ncbi:MAG TPA: Glu/Leu/Phe/Val dehydrogenase dimerization domain-containing protein [Phenylobacterium sp.]|uniref:Glu/Leu/Phe/Val dehydrogenase dimerization domain-containing protein n=1 Tax=Phenylobacterium sp. TaxID=1871053 RepID=UPI002C836E28|nr:Glu/Leu/Phe/Val dehydrogenase dimerization domain-containing protein [Phenylobacterium sp.]HSV03454.1 Glu/Leu/Phe/Val dehydrogenase dimerization domain-containing protein [Phenylobacterium sp.]
MTLFDSPDFEGHEGVHAFFDERSGLKCVIAVHSTARGPAAGGCRMWPYASAEAAQNDALRLSRAMSFKNAMADLDLGGGKAVILGDSRTEKTPALFEAFGRAVEALGGRYWTAEDVGVSPADLVHARKATRHVAGLEGHPAASGDPSPVTAEGVFRGLRLCVRRALGRDLDNVTVAMQGVGHVGGHLADKLAAAGARLVITDVNPEVLHAVAARTGARIVPPAAIFDAEAEVFAPCALGGSINADTLPRLRARVIAGAANNQLADAATGQAVFARGILYAPDYVLNGGGIINVAGEIRALECGEAFDPAWVEAKLDRLARTLEEVLDRAKAEHRPTSDVANEIARSRISLAAEAKRQAA